MRSLWFVIAISMGLVVSAKTVSIEENPLSPIMISLVTPAQIPTSEYDVKGLRLDLLYGQCQNLYGLDLGLVNYTVKQEFGLTAGLVNYTDGKVVGLQIGGVNIGDRVKALQVGLYNEADDMSGLQLGLINHSRMMRGVQIGLVNVIESNDLPFFPIVNFFF